MRSWHSVAFLTVSLLLGMTSVIAQGLVTQPFPQPYPSVSFQYQRPDFKTSRGIDPFSGAFELAGSYPLSEYFVISAHIPWGFYTSEYSDKFILGNVGLAISSGWRSGEKTTFAGSLLLSLKTSPGVDDNSCHCSDAEFASFVGWYADPYQAQRFTQRHWMIGGNFQAQHKHSAALTLGAEFGPQWYIPTHKSDRSQLVFNTGLLVNAGLKRIRGVVEYVASFSTLSERPFGPYCYEDMVGFGMQVISNGPELTVYYQTILDAAFDGIVNGSYGFRLNWPLGEREDS